MVVFVEFPGYFLSMAGAGKHSSKSAHDLILEVIENSQPELHWGRWIRNRSAFVGFRRQQDFREAIGCTRSQLFKWLQSEKSPDRIFKGFDARLASALKTDRHTLLIDWKLFPDPSEVPILKSFDVDEFLEVQDMRERLALIVKNLPIERLRRVIESARSEAKALDVEIMSSLRRQWSKTREAKK